MSRPPPVTYGSRSGKRRPSSEAPLAALAEYAKSSSPSPPDRPSSPSQDLGGYGEEEPVEVPDADTAIASERDAGSDDEPMFVSATKPAPVAAAAPASNAPRIVFTVNPEFRTVTAKDTFGAREVDYPFCAGLPAVGGPYFDGRDPRWASPTVSLDRKSYVTGKFVGHDGDTYHIQKGMEKRVDGAEPPMVHLVPPAYAHPAMHPNVLANCAPFLAPVNEFPANSNIYPVFETTRGIRAKSGISRPAYDANHANHKDDAMPFWAECAFPCHRCDTDKYDNSPLKQPHYCAVTTFQYQNDPGVPPNARRLKCQSCVAASQTCLFEFMYKEKLIRVELYVLFFENKDAHPTDMLEMLWWKGKDSNNSKKAPSKSAKKTASKRSRPSGSAGGSKKKKAKVEVEEPEVDHDGDDDAERDFEMEDETGSSAAGPSGLRSESSPRASSIGDEGSMINWKDYIGSRSESDIVEPDEPLKGDDGMPTDRAASVHHQPDHAPEPTVETATTAGNGLNLAVDNAGLPQTASSTPVEGETAVNLEQRNAQPRQSQHSEATPAEDKQADSHDSPDVSATASKPVATDDKAHTALSRITTPIASPTDEIARGDGDMANTVHLLDKTKAAKIALLQAELDAEMAGHRNTRSLLSDEAQKEFEAGVRALRLQLDAKLGEVAVSCDAAEEASRAKFNTGVDDVDRQMANCLAFLT
ncbi:uncharacterized protein LOC62_03G005068 [Vanrija pseudolonga]|uniref:Uncharacterized protein n=1 Tax=Vanrija pseudolonga TaxID=143232 RepID=A0AAF0Y7X9_9TREE|nr:hypothetical protein LOC62_03G005068 [Vanrija pseudolonga]